MFFMRIIFDYNRTIFDPDTDDIYPGVLELLQRLSIKYELFLVSRNEPARKERVKDLAIDGYFQEIVFVDKKSKQIFEKISGNSEIVVVVGDSIRDEIAIGNQLGFVTVRIKKGIFATMVPMCNDESPQYEIMDIRELENILSRYEK